MANQAFLKVAIASILIVSCSAAGAFLELVNSNATEIDAEQRLLTELASVAKQTAASSRIAELQELLRPLFDAIPKEGDRVSHAVVIYMLHRFFATHRGWTIRGLEPNGVPQNSSDEMQGWMPMYLQNFLEAIVGSSSLSLREIAVFAATLEDFIQKEERQWLEKVYSLLWMPTSSLVGKDQLTTVLETYLMIYNLEGNFTTMRPEDIKKMLAEFSRTMKVWTNTQAFLRKTLDDAWPASREGTFEEVLTTVKDVGEHYSSVYDNDCRDMKKELVKFESRKPGRVRLTDFYKVSLNGGVWEFSEKKEYLRSFGALDETDPTTPLVIIPNYVGGRQNCLTASSYYALCCRNECEDLLGSLEKKLAAPMADPAQVISLVKSMSSNTVAAPRELSAALVDRLERVASLNGGQVPLHGRLFAQWMHHAFPRECAYPHESGTTSALTPDEWMKETGQEDSKATTEEMLEHVRNDTCRLTPVGVSCGRPRGLVTKASQEQEQAVEERTPVQEEADRDLPWNEKEELLVVRPLLEKTASSKGSNYLKDALVFVILAAMVSALSMSYRSVFKLAAPAQKSEKCVV